MKIAMLSSFYAPHRGGTEKYVNDLSVNLVKRGHDVTVFTHTRGKSIIEKGVRIVRVPAFWLMYLPVPCDWISDELYKFDIINTHIPPSVFPFEVPKTIEVPHIITYHCDPFLPAFYKGKRLSRIVRRIGDSYARKQAVTVLKKADSIIVTSDDYASTSEIVGNLEYTAVPIGVDKEAFFEEYMEIKRRLSDRDASGDHGSNIPVILYVGRLSPGKGLDVLLKAVSLLKTAGRRFRVEIVGTGEEYMYLRNLSGSLGLNRVVSFKGSLPHQELVRSLYRARTLVLPSCSRLEAFGIVQLEAFCAATPVIASSIPGVRQIVKDTGGGWLFPPGDSVELAERINYVIENPHAAREAGLRGYSSIDTRYNWDSIAREIEKIFLGCLRDKDDHKTA